MKISLISNNGIKRVETSKQQRIMIEIIKVSKKDLTVITDLIVNVINNDDSTCKPLSNKNLEKLLDDHRSYLFAAIIDGRVVGYVLAYRFPSLYSEGFLAYLYDIEVLQKHRRKGVGKLLIETMLANLKSDGVKELWLGTAVDNAEGQGLFSSTGAEKSDEIFNDYTYNLA